MVSQSVLYQTEITDLNVNFGRNFKIVQDRNQSSAHDVFHVLLLK